jgi:hypothetical protein
VACADVSCFAGNRFADTTARTRESAATDRTDEPIVGSLHLLVVLRFC